MTRGILSGALWISVCVTVLSQPVIHPSTGIIILPEGMRIELASVDALLWRGDKGAVQRWAKENNFLFFEIESRLFALAHPEVVYPNFLSWQSLLHELTHEETKPLSQLPALKQALRRPEESLLFPNIDMQRSGLHPYILQVAEIQVGSHVVEVELQTLSSPFQWDTLAKAISSHPPSTPIKEYPQWKVVLCGFEIPTADLSKTVARAFEKLAEYQSKEPEMIADLVKQWQETLAQRYLPETLREWNAWNQLPTELQTQLRSALEGRPLSETETIRAETLTHLQDQIQVRIKVRGGYQLGIIDPDNKKWLYHILFGKGGITVMTPEVLQ